MRAAVDVMGGDNAPKAILDGCWEAAPLLDESDLILLVGDEAVIRPALDASPLTADQKKLYTIVHTTQVVAMDESPVEAVRGKPDSSISVVAKLVSKGEADVAISAGNTGAFAAASQLRMRLLPGVVRPGIAVGLPTPAGVIVLCDAGANVGAKPHHLLQYALMAGAFRHDRVRHREAARRTAERGRGRRKRKLAGQERAPDAAGRVTGEFHRQR